MQYGLVADSGCDRSQELQDEMDIHYVPLQIRIGQKEYADDETLDFAALHAALKDGSTPIKSACSAPGEWAQAFLAHPAQAVFGITIADKHSGSYNSALLGAQEAREQGKRVHVFNSKSITSGELLVAKQILAAVREGLEFDAIVDRVTTYVDRMQTYAVLKTTDGLVKNGRMPNFLGKAVTALNIKLILCSDGQGVITLRSKARGFEAAMQKMVDLLADTCSDFKSRTLIISHIENEEGARKVAELAVKAYHFADVIISRPGGLGSLYAGVGGIVISY